VEIHLGTVDPADFATGIVTAEADGSRRSVLRTRNADGNPNTETLAMTGIIDTWSTSFDQASAKVSLRGRDMRGVLLDTPINVVPNAVQTLLDSLNLAVPIDQVVTQILRFNPNFDQFNAIANAAEWENNIIPSPGLNAAVPRHQRDARGQRAGARAGGGGGDSNNLNFWDLVVRMCYLVGAIPYFRGTQLLIRPTRAIYDQARAGIDPAIQTPFAFGQVRASDAQTGMAITPALSFRRMVYGRDIDTLEFERKYAGYQKPRVIRCVSSMTQPGARGTMQAVEARWPTATATSTQGQNARSTRVAPNNSTAQEEILNVPVPGISDPAQLQEIAKAVFEEIGRGEITGSCSTKNLASFGGDNRDPDLCRLRPGDGVEFVYDVRANSGINPLISTPGDLQRTPFATQVQELTQRIGSENLARVIVATTRGLIFQVQTFFRVSNVKRDWTSDKGIKISFDFQNYVVPRFEIGSVSPSPGTATITTVPGST
jgi:hypothetical protein